MSTIILVMTCLAIVPIGFCLYTAIRRFLQCIRPNINHNRRIILIILCLFLLPLLFFTGTWLVILLHLCAFILITQFLHFLYLRHYKKPLPVITKLYKLCILPILCTVLLISYGFYNVTQIHMTNYTITTHKKLDAPLRIALLSDLHYGTALHKSNLSGYIEMINAQHPDLVVLDGDIVDESTTKEEMSEVFTELSKLKSTYGTFYVYGNHDVLKYRTKTAFTEKELTQTIRDNNITILMDEAYPLRDDVTLIGRKDATLTRKQGRKSAQELLDGVDRTDFLLLLDHQPKELNENDKAGYDLQLSGHTHAGQVWPLGTFGQLFGFMEKSYGYRSMNHMQLIVTSGCSVWGMPIRTQEHNEIVMVTVKSTK